MSAANPTLTTCEPAEEKNTGTAVQLCSGGSDGNPYWKLEANDNVGAPAADHSVVLDTS